MEEDYRNAPAHRFARDIAGAMGAGWQYDVARVDNARVGYIAGPNGARLGIILDPWYDDPEHEHNNYRVEVIGCYPELLGERVRPHKHGSPTITCAPSRGAAAIGRDIKNRFLADYWPALEETYSIAADREREFYRMLDGMGVLSETLEAPFHPEPRADRVATIRFSGKDIHATIQWSGQWGVHMDVRWLPLEVAVEIAEVLKRHENAQIPAHMEDS